MTMLNDLYTKAREMRSKIVDKTIDEGNVDEMLSEVSKAEDELKKIVALSIRMKSFVYAKISSFHCNFEDFMEFYL